MFSTKKINKLNKSKLNKKKFRNVCIFITYLFKLK